MRVAIHIDLAQLDFCIVKGTRQGMMLTLVS